uniref:EGF-like domain-containing protein n=1 Tax=Syphacia muris TaxID=451379 RepID=A0A0N5A7N9_9BILA
MLCATNTCGINGICENVNATHFRCICKPFFGGEKCDKFKLIEHAAFFNGKAYIMFASSIFNHKNSEATESIEFRFKTNSSDSVSNLNFAVN